MLAILFMGLVAVCAAQGASNDTVRGCTCVSDCETTFGFLAAWCYTSPPGGPAPIDPCGYRLQAQNAYWDYCLEGAEQTQVFRTFRSMYWELVRWTVMICSTAFGAFAIYASSACATRGMLVLPLAVVASISAYGALMSFIAGLVVFLPVTYIFLAMPYALGRLEVAFLAAALSLVLLYLHSGRGALPMRREVGAGKMPPSSVASGSATGT